MKKINSILLVLLFSVTTIMAQVNLKNGLVACYPFNANANDQSSNGNNGTINGATLTTDRFGKANSAYNFDGDSYISINPNQLKNQSYTYATWVNLDAIPTEGDQNCFIVVGGVGADQGLVVASNYSINSANGFSVGGYNSGNPIVSSNWSVVKPDVGRWYHAVVTRDNVSIKLYVDGVLISNNSPNTATNGTLPAYASPTYAVIGSRVGANGYFQSLRGSLDDIYIYNRAITAEEVTALYQSTKLPTVDLKDGLMACYPFNSNANDESSNGNNGTVNGATLTSDRFGKANSAYNFNGSNFIALPSDKFAFNEFSYAVWVNVSANPTFGGAYRILSIGGNCGDQDINIGNNYFEGGISGIGGGGYNISSPTTNSGVVAGTLPTTGQWYHGVITRDRNEIKLYVNGTFIRSVSTEGTLPYYGCDGTVFANIGSRSNQTQSFVGSLDDLHIYNRAINADEVKALYEGSSSSTITITADKTAPCGGDNILFTANGGSVTSKYQWKVNDVNVGTQTNLNTFSYDSPNKSTDYQVKITVEITDDEICFPNKTVLKDAYFNIKNCTPCVNSLLACVPFNVVKTK